MEVQQKPIVHIDKYPFINISLYLKSIKPIQSLHIENRNSENSEEIEILISSDIDCFEAFHYKIPFIPALSDINIPLDNLKINRSIFNKITETEIAHIKNQRKRTRIYL